MTQHKLRNLKFICSWNGRNYEGYQTQPHSKTIEDTLAKSWKILSKESEKIIGCSRLDSGVHAKSYVFNIHSKIKLSPEKIIKAFNGILLDRGHSDISIYDCEAVPQDFHARFSAQGKHYRYLIWHGIGEHVWYRDIAWHVKIPHSLESLENILKIFEGRHDFNSFRASDCGAQNTIKTISKISVTQHKVYPELYIIDVYGNGFLKNMIRNLVGAAILVIKEKRSLQELQERLQSAKKEYNLCAPGHALTLMQVYYLPIQKVEKIDS